MQPVYVSQNLAVVDLGVDAGRDRAEDEHQKEIKTEERQLGCRPRAVEVEEEARVGHDGEGEEVGGELLRVDVRGQGGAPGEIEGVDPRGGEASAVGPYPRGRGVEEVLLPPPRPMIE